MKIQSLNKLPLRYKFAAIALLGMLMIAVAMGIANKISSAATENRFNNEKITSQDILWQRIINSQFNKLQVGVNSLRRQQRIPRALAEGDDERTEEYAEQTLVRLQAANILQHLQITDETGKIIYCSNDSSGKSQLPIVQKTLAEKKQRKDIQISKNGTLKSVVALPLFSNGEFVGTSVFIQGIQTAIKTFADENKLDAFIASADGKLLHSTHSELYEKLSPTLPALGETSVSRYKVDKQYYSVAIQAVTDKTNKPISHLVTARDITESYLSERNTQWLVYICVSIVIILCVVVLSYYIFYSFKPLNALLDTVHKMHAGDTMARTNVQHDDEIGELGTAFNKMADEVVDRLYNEKISKEDLEEKIELLHDTVQKVGAGDLNAEVMSFSGTQGIDQLASGIQSMIDSLNKLVSQVQQSGIQVTSSTTEIAATAKEQEATVTEQAAATNQIMATATQISATTRELASTMHEVADVAEKTTDSANDGQEALVNMENTMMQMNNATASITSKLAVLSEKAANINTVVTTITKVADQTNLLSLNAAIEAEKAGEYGLGFAVVATEIRRLADQTAVATWDIEQMVKEMQSAVSAGVMGMDKFSEEVTRGVDEVRDIGGKLAHIIEQVQTLTPRFEAVNEGMQSQSHGAQQISDGMVQLNDSTQQTVDSLRQSNISIDSLKGAASTLQESASKFRVK